MKSIVMGLDPERVYREAEINDALQDWKRDVVGADGRRQARHARSQDG